MRKNPKELQNVIRIWKKIVKLHKKFQSIPISKHLVSFGKNIQFHKLHQIQTCNLFFFQISLEFNHANHISINFEVWPHDNIIGPRLFSVKNFF